MKKSILSTFVLLVLLKASQVFSQGYQLDPSFDGDGVKVINFAAMDPIFGFYKNPLDEAQCVATDVNDKILVGGYVGSGTVSKNFVIYRFNEDGSTDNSFGNSGKAIINVDVKGGVVTSIKVMPDGKILLAGYAFNQDEVKQLVVVRINPNGSLDTSFGTNGISKTEGVAGSALSLWMNDLIIAPDGKIILTAFVYSYEYYVFHYVRLNSNGTFETTLDEDGMYVKGTSFQSFGSTLDDAGNLMILGVYEGRKGLLRLRSDGVLDSTFSTHGVAAVENLVPRGVFNSNSKITIGGKLTASNDINKGIKLKRFNQNGSVDDTFGNNGEVAIEYYANGFVPQINKIKNQNNKILFTGYKEDNTGSGSCASSPSTCFSFSVTNTTEDFWILSLNEDGTVDNSFGTSGTQIIPISTNSEDRALDITMDSHGRVIAVGYVLSEDPYYRDIAIVRLASTTTGLSLRDNTSNISVYPNPGNGNFKFNLNSMENASEISIINSQGIVIEKVSVKSQGKKVNIDLTDHPSGIYMAEVFDGDRIERVKLIKE